MKKFKENLKKIPKKAYLIAGIASAAIILVACLIIGLSGSNEQDIQLKILGEEYNLPLTVRNLENIGFTTDDANSEYQLKEGEDSVEFKDINYIFKNKYNSKVDPATIPENDGMHAIVDFIKYKNNREITKIVFPANTNNGEYIAINGLYLKDMTFDNIVKTFGEEYESDSDSNLGALSFAFKKNVKYTYEDYSITFDFMANKISKITIEMVNEEG